MVTDRLKQGRPLVLDSTVIGLLPNVNYFLTSVTITL